MHRYVECTALRRHTFCFSKAPLQLHARRIVIIYIITMPSLDTIYINKWESHLSRTLKNVIQKVHTSVTNHLISSNLQILCLCSYTSGRLWFFTYHMYIYINFFLVKKKLRVDRGKTGQWDRVLFFLGLPYIPYIYIYISFSINFQRYMLLQ